MFTPERRDRVRERVVEMAQADPRVTGGALTGSSALGAEDAWSDVDVAFGIAEGHRLENVLRDWTERFGREFDVLHHFDLRAGPGVYRVFLLPDGLELDVGVAPEPDFGPRGPRFRPLFGASRQQPPAPPPDARHLIGLCWHHALHANSCIERGKPWQAEYWISALRDYTLALACLRLGLDADYARDVDRLPAAVTAPLAGALVRALDPSELRRARGVAINAFIAELVAQDSALAEQLAPLLREFAGE